MAPEACSLCGKELGEGPDACFFVLIERCYGMFGEDNPLLYFCKQCVAARVLSGPLPVAGSFSEALSKL